MNTVVRRPNKKTVTYRWAQSTKQRVCRSELVFMEVHHRCVLRIYKENGPTCSRIQFKRLQVQSERMNERKRSKGRRQQIQRIAQYTGGCTLKPRLMCLFVFISFSTLFASTRNLPASKRSQFDSVVDCLSQRTRAPLLSSRMLLFFVRSQFESQQKRNIEQQKREKKTLSLCD